MHPLLSVAVFLSAPVVGLTHNHHDWLGYAAFVTAVAGLVTAIGGVVLTALKIWIDSRETPTKRRRRR